MKRFVVFALAAALAPATALAQSSPQSGQSGMEGGPPPLPPIAGAAVPNAQQMAAMQQMHKQIEQSRLQTRARLLAALTPQHRTAVATVVGQLVLSSNPDPRAAAQQLDAVFAPAEKQSIVNIDTAQRANMQALMEQMRTSFEATLSADQRAQLAQREARMQTFMQSHPPADLADPGTIVLRTLGNFGFGKFGGLTIQAHVF